MSHHPHQQRCQQAVQQALQAGLLGPDEPSLVFHDLDLLEQGVNRIRALFPDSTLHAVAIKANPIVGVLAHLVGLGAGLEAASREEVELALAAGCPPARLVFDSPAKTEAELAFALDRGLVINADNPLELERLDHLIGGGTPASRIGLRINPGVGEGSIALTSVASKDSKFGVPLDDQGESVVQAFARYNWLQGLHVHVGSQGCTVELTVDGVARVFALADQVEARLGAGRISTFDLGGGLPAGYRPEDAPPAWEDYRSALHARLPGLFAGRFQLITEFGRSLQAPCGFAVARVEYVKRSGGSQVAVMHLGADMFLRAAYLPEDWFHQVSLLDARGNLKSGPVSDWTLAGPLCFGGDLLARSRSLPAVEPGDLVVIHDAGAYTMGMWSRHCSRALPAVVGCRSDGSDLKPLKRRESPQDVVRFWS